MATYKVPQNVEAEDKLLGPFTFRQFIYLLITAGAIFMAWILAQIFIGLLLIPLPVIILFGVLSLPLRKDQPMETYLLALIRFWTKPRVRIWDPEGNIAMVEVVAPVNVDNDRTNGLSRDDASQRLSYLAQLVDSGGWSTKGVMNNTNMNDTYAAEAQNAVDFMDDSANLSKNFDTMIDQYDDQRRQTLLSQMQQYSQTPTVTQSSPDPVYQQPQTQPVASEPLRDQTYATNEPVTPDPQVSFDPYPTSMRQHVISPQGRPPEPPKHQPTYYQPPARQAEPEPPVRSEPSPDIINLAHNKNLSVESLQNEAKRLSKQNGEEVVISLH